MPPHEEVFSVDVLEVQDQCPRSLCHLCVQDLTVFGGDGHSDIFRWRVESQIYGVVSWVVVESCECMERLKRV